MTKADKLLVAFVTESNRIEGILRPPIDEELEASAQFLDLPEVTVDDLASFVRVCAGASLRDRYGLNVAVGSHRPPSGGPGIRHQLEELLRQANNGVDYHPYLVHVEYETLHPFMDGNGRSGRILWAWQMLRQEVPPGLRLGFLHCFYYQALEHSRGE